jgi:heterotetrameric sarcosine oxidase gamma subunit
MLERKSALAELGAFEAEGFRMAESPDFSIHHMWFGSNAQDIVRDFGHMIGLPDKIGTVATSKLAKKPGETYCFWIAPDQYWLITKHGADGAKIHGLTSQLAASSSPLHSSRCRIELAGPRARDVLAKCAAVDFHSKVFTTGKFAMTGIHHMPVLIHCVETGKFHVYALRTFALHLWEVLTDAAHS